MDWTPLVAALPQGGSIVAFVVVVVIFLKHIKEDALDRGQTHKLCEERLEKITNKCLDVFEEHTKAFTELKDTVKSFQKVA